MTRLVAALLLAFYLALVTCLSVAGARDDPPVEDAVAVPTSPPGGGGALGRTRKRAAKLERKLQIVQRTVTRQQRVIRRQRSVLRRRWRPTVSYALRLASAVSGVSYWELRAVSWCESRHWPFATNGRYKGLFQLGWQPFGMPWWDPIANALSAALTVRADGSWRQWSCKP